MAKKVHKNQTDGSLEGIEQALTRTEQFIGDNSKNISYAIFGVIAVVLIFIGVKRFYVDPLEEEASSQMYLAEKFFEQDSFNYALNGYGNYPGFIQVIEHYGITKTANLAKYYAGVSSLNIGDYEQAIDYLKDFKTDDLLIGAAKFSSLGDAYVESGDFSAAVGAYKNGIKEFTNDFSTPILLKKTGIAYEEMGEYDKAIETFKELKSKYPNSVEGRDIDKYIASAEMKQ